GSEVVCAIWSGEDFMGANDRVRLHAGGSAECEQRRLVPHQEIDETGKEAGIADRIADFRGSDARQRQETGQQLRFSGEPAEDRDGGRLGLLRRGCIFLAFHRYSSGNLSFNQPTGANVVAVELGDFGFAATYRSATWLQ